MDATAFFLLFFLTLFSYYFFLLSKKVKTPYLTKRYKIEFIYP